MRRNRIAPCKGCKKERDYTCHASCEEYKEFQKLRKEELEARRYSIVDEYKRDKARERRGRR